MSGDEAEELRRQVHQGRALCKGLLHVVEARMKADNAEYEKHIHKGSLIDRARAFIRGEAECS